MLKNPQKYIFDVKPLKPALNFTKKTLYHVVIHDTGQTDKISIKFYVLY